MFDNDQKIRGNYFFFIKRQFWNNQKTLDKEIDYLTWTNHVNLVDIFSVDGHWLKSPCNSASLCRKNAAPENFTNLNTTLFNFLFFIESNTGKYDMIWYDNEPWKVCFIYTLNHFIPESIVFMHTSNILPVFYWFVIH